MADHDDDGQHDDMCCEEEYNCYGYVKGDICLPVRMRCDCPEPPPPVTYKTRIHQLPCDVKQIQVGAETQAYLNANPDLELLSILDIGHAGWILILREPC